MGHHLGESKWLPLASGSGEVGGMDLGAGPMAGGQRPPELARLTRPGRGSVELDGGEGGEGMANDGN